MANLSKIKIGDILYDIGDAQARADFATLLGDNTLEALEAAAWKSVTTTLTAAGTDLPTAGTVKSYVDTEIAALSTLEIVVVPADESLPTASVDTMKKLYLKAVSGGAQGDAHDEYITIRTGTEGAYEYNWEKIGSTRIDLSDYVLKATTIAGIDLQDNITADELEEALGLGDLAKKDGGSVTVSTADSVTINEYTPEGTVTVNPLIQTPTTSDTITYSGYTPTGSVTGTVSVPKSAALTRSDDGINVTGSVSAPTITFDKTHIYGVPKTAVTCHMAEESEIGGGVDAETLIFVQPESINVFHDIGATCSTPTFTGDKFAISLTNENANINGSFIGTEAQIKATGVTYYKAAANGGSFAGTAATLTGELTKTDKTIDIDFE